MDRSCKKFTSATVSFLQNKGASFSEVY